MRGLTEAETFRQLNVPGGRDFGDQADLRTGDSDLRLAMKAARRLPRVHGMTVSLAAAVAITLLTNRVFVFMAQVLDVLLGFRPLLRPLWPCNQASFWPGGKKRCALADFFSDFVVKLPEFTKQLNIIRKSGGRKPNLA